MVAEVVVEQRHQPMQGQEEEEQEEVMHHHCALEFVTGRRHTRLRCQQTLLLET